MDNVFVVIKNYGYGFYGVFENLDSFFSSFKKENYINQAKLFHEFSIKEVNGKEIIDENDVSDIIEIDDLLDEAKNLIRNGVVL